MDQSKSGEAKPSCLNRSQPALLWVKTSDLNTLCHGLAGSANDIRHVKVLDTAGEGALIGGCFAASVWESLQPQITTSTCYPSQGILIHQSASVQTLLTSQPFVGLEHRAERLKQRWCQLMKDGCIQVCWTEHPILWWEAGPTLIWGSMKTTAANKRRGGGGGESD